MVGSTKAAKRSQKPKETAAWAPARGEIITIDFNPQAGKEIMKRRPALVVSPNSYNRKVGMALVCPITSKAKGFPFEVLLLSGMSVHGAVLADQVRCLDWRTRNAQRVEDAPAAVVSEVLAKIETLVT